MIVEVERLPKTGENIQSRSPNAQLALGGKGANQAIAAARQIPYFAVNHLEGHALSPRLADDVAFPYLLLLVSGGHTQLLAVAGPGDYRRYGTTMDDAAGEAFDKCAKAMGLGYPGGPAIEAAAKSGDAKAVALPRPLKGSTGCHFSFSGLKTALVNRLSQLGGPEAAPIADLAASLQAAIADCLADRTKAALTRFREEFPHNDANQPVLVIAGGVAANQHVFAVLQRVATDANFRLSVPPAKLCTDNAAMIAWAGAERFAAGLIDDLTVPARPRWPLDPAAEKARGAGVKA